jgi:sortase (surface protein transpeptidase)
VDSLKYGLGALAELGRARQGDVIELRADGHRQRYRVTGIQKIPQAQLTSATAAFRQDVAHRLVVITCGGPFDRGRHRYLDNVVVTAVPIG